MLNQEISPRLGSLENEIKALKEKLHISTKKWPHYRGTGPPGPEQKRIAVAERISRALEDLQEQLKLTTTARLKSM